jgi:hypothetical protein
MKGLKMNLKELKTALSAESVTLFPEATSREKWHEIKTSDYYAQMREEAEILSKTYLSAPIKSLPYSKYKLFAETGSREEYENEYFEHRGRLAAFGILFNIHETDEIKDALEDIIWAVCDEYTWCVPSHAPDGGVNPDMVCGGLNELDPLRRCDETLDLFSAETAFALSEILYMHEKKLDSVTVKRARSEIYRRVIKPYTDIKPMFWWETTDNNWSAVCGGSIGAAAIYMIDNPDILAPVLLRVLNTLECFLDGFGKDGACLEGLGYWRYGFGYFVYFAELLKQRTNGAIDLMNSEKIHEIALFPQRCVLCERSVINFSDVSSKGLSFRPGLTHKLKELFPDINAFPPERRSKFTDDHCFRFAQSLRDFVWNNPNYALQTADFKPKSHYWENAQWFVSKAKENNLQICVAAKCGHNNEPHNHNDVGSFILCANDEMIFEDLGMGKYDKAYFNPATRYNSLCTSSLGHCVPIVEQSEQKGGAEFSGYVSGARLGDEKDSFETEISGAYKLENLLSLNRLIVHEKPGGKVSLTDSYKFKTPPSSLTERFVTSFPVEILSDSVIIRGEKIRVSITYDKNKLKPKTSSAAFESCNGTKSVNLLDFEWIPSDEKEFTLQFEFILLY